MGGGGGGGGIIGHSAYCLWTMQKFNSFSEVGIAVPNYGTTKC